MRELTFKGFLTQYVKQLSYQETGSLHKLAAEAGSNNPRLREPLLLYAMFAEKQDVLLMATKDTPLHDYYAGLASQYLPEQMTTLLAEGSPLLAEEYHKVWRSYMSRKNRLQADNHTKELIRKKIKHLQEKSGVSNYRIYTDLNLNPGNLNAWLKCGDSDKVSLDTARRALQYVEGRADMNHTMVTDIDSYPRTKGTSLENREMCVMREEYDFSCAKENPYVEKLREQTATNNDESAVVTDMVQG